VAASWRLDGATAVVETALASGLQIVGGAGHNDPTGATSRGTGELIAEAIDAGARDVLVGVGGSAMTDGGAGAVGVLERLAPLDGSRGWTVTLACDVRTSFVRAATDFAPQKGATPAQVAELEQRLDRLADDYRVRFGRDVRNLPGAGAAGGLAGGLAALGARLVGGAAQLAAHLGLAAHLAGADLVVTGEGQLDATSFDGKVVGTVVAMARERGVRVLVVVGANAIGAAVPVGGLDVVSLTERFGARRSFGETSRCLTAAVAERLS
jgi:glycerate kinase